MITFQPNLHVMKSRVWLNVVRYSVCMYSVAGTRPI